MSDPFTDAVTATQSTVTAAQNAVTAAQNVQSSAQTSVTAAQTAQSSAQTLTSQLNAANTQHTTDQATIARLQAANTADEATVAQLKAAISTLNPRFPGDPGPGKIVVGGIISGAAGNADAFEQANGVKLGNHRAYFTTGASDLAVGGPALTYISAEHTAGRVPIVSVKLDWTKTVQGAYDANLKAFRDAVEKLAKPVDFIVNHEPENDGQPASLYCQEQQHVRNVIGRVLKRLSFGGSLMNWTFAAGSGLNPDDWFPGNAADGLPVWDWCGLDHYTRVVGNAVEDAPLTAAVAALRRWGVVPGFTELGIRAADTAGPAELKQLFEDVLSMGFVKFCYYDSDAGPVSPPGWVLTGPLLAQFVSLCKDPRAVHPAA